MAKKKTAKKKTTKKPAARSTKTSKASSSSARASSKKVTKKTSKKPAAKKKVVKKTTKKVAKKTTQKTTVKKTVAKKVAKKTTKKTKAISKPAAKKTTKKKAPATSPKSVTKKTTKKAATTKSTTASTKAETKPAAKTDAKTDAKPASSPARRRRPSKVKKPLVLPTRPLLLGPNGPSLKPLIPSGSDVKKDKSVLDNVTSRRTKTPLTKTQLEHYRHVLLVKRAELLGDMRHLEEEALRSDSGITSHTSQHLAEQGSESYEQSLNLNLAASDRKLINEIDDALQRIVDRTYGLCELTHEPINKARLDELPWARYTIQAAREVDKRGGSI
ncbi:MAG: TraR/DksA family transcriptional regulator [Phycisphaerales bacterium]|nr:TraR/DksA family transcriptional regulator [Phycisphaerales bacterium]